MLSLRLWYSSRDRKSVGVVCCLHMAGFFHCSCNGIGNCNLKSIHGLECISLNQTHKLTYKFEVLKVHLTWIVLSQGAWLEYFWEFWSFWYNIAVWKNCHRRLSTLNYPIQWSFNMRFLPDNSRNEELNSSVWSEESN